MMKVIDVTRPNNRYASITPVDNSTKFVQIQSVAISTHNGDKKRSDREIVADMKQKDLNTLLALVVRVDDHSRLKSEVQAIAHSAEPPIAVEGVRKVLAVTVLAQKSKPNTH